MNPRRSTSIQGILALTLLLAPAPANASILDALGNLWETGKEKVGGLFESGKEKVSGLLGRSPRGGGEELEALMGQIESAQETVATKGDNVSGYLSRLNGRAPGAATRPFLQERMRDLETAQRTLGELYSRLGQAVAAAGGVQELKTEERQRIGLIQRQQQILVATAQQLEHRTDRALAGQPVPAAQPLDLPDGPLPPIEEETGASTRPPENSREEPPRETAVTLPEPPAEEPPPPPEETEPASREAPSATPAPEASEALDTETPEGVQSWGSYERMRREQEEAERTEREDSGTTIVKADSAEAFGGVRDDGRTGDEEGDRTTQVKADDASAFGGSARGEVDGEASDAEEHGYGAAGRPGGTPEHPKPAGTEEGEAGDGEASEGDGEASVSVPALTAQATGSGPRTFDPEDSEMGGWVDEWLQAAGLDEYGRWVSPSAITANGPADTDGLPRRTWVVAVHGDKSFGTNMSLNAYIAARLKGDRPSVARVTNPDGTPLGTEPGGSGGPRSVPSTRSRNAAGASSQRGQLRSRKRDAQYLQLRQALERGSRGAVQEAYGSYSGGN
jgi:hypothetical protein